MFFQGCMEDDLKLEKGWDEYNRPVSVGKTQLFTSNMSAIDVLNQINDSTVLITDDEGLIIAKYSQPILAEWYDVAKISNVSLNISHNIDPTGLKADIIFEDRIKLNLLPQQRFDSILLNDATLNVSVDWPEGIVGNYTVTFPDIVKNSNPLIFTHDPATDLVAAERLPNYYIYPRRGIDSSYVRIQIKATINSVSPLATSTVVSAQIQFESLTPEVLWGNFGVTNVLDQDFDMSFNFFEGYDLFHGIEFTGMYAKLDIKNYTGTPYNVVLPSAVFKRKKNGETVNLTFNGNNSINIGQPEYAKPVIPKSDSLRIDDSNSNIKDAFNLFPDHFNYHMTITTNPDGDTTRLNFINRYNKVDGLMDVFIPFWFRITDLHRNDTIKFDINKILIDSSNADYVDTMKLMFEFENGFPFELYSQGYLTDSLNNVVDSLFDTDGLQALWLSGKLDNSDKVIEPTLNKVNVVFDSESVKLYSKKHVDRVILHTRASTTSSGNRYVKLYDNYRLTIRFYFSLDSNPDKYLNN
jgi:hypothetical protein